MSGVSYGWARLDPQIAIETIREAYELGIRFFDTADFYGLGLAEELLAKALPRDDEIVLASKGGMLVSQTQEPRVMKSFESSYLEAAVHRSLKRLRRDHIEVYQLHGPPKEMVSNHPMWQTMEKLVKEGKIGAFGVAVSGSLATSTLGDWAAIDGLGWLQIPYSLAVPDVVSLVEESEFLNDRKIGLIGRSVFHHGILVNRDLSKDRYGSRDYRSTVATVPMVEQVGAFWVSIGISVDRVRTCLDFALSSPKLDTVLVGASSPAQIRQIVAGARVAETMTFEERNILLNEARRLMA